MLVINFQRFPTLSPKNRSKKPRNVWMSRQVEAVAAKEMDHVLVWNIETSKQKNPSFEGVFVSVETTKFMEVLKIVCGGDVNSCDFCLAYLAFWSYNIQKWWHFSRILSILSGVVCDVGLIFSRYWKSWTVIRYKTCYNNTNLIWFFLPYPRSCETPGSWLRAK